MDVGVGKIFIDIGICCVIVFVVVGIGVREVVHNVGVRG